MDTERNKVYYDVVTTLYATLKEAHETDDLSYFEIIGILDKLHYNYKNIIMLPQTKRNGVYYRILMELQGVLETAYFRDRLTHFEIVGILEKLKEHFISNATINITDIMIKREIKRNFKGE